ncbi:transporter [Mesorhizobium sp. ZMM04-5]|uniref:Transporter n=1 Tax=Mesorhizobium marinum TaxID=3228790 RepID=A0ABV3R2J1_9HYPH
MPSAEEIQQYLTGAWRMMLGRADGLKMLDLSADGFWNSFFALVVAAPPLIVGWVGFANELAGSAGFGGRLSTVLMVATIDLAIWIVPLLALAAVASRAGIADRFVHLVVAGNWSSALIAWIMLPPALLDLFAPSAAGVSVLLSFALFVLTLVLSWRMTNVALDKGPAMASAVFAGMFIVAVAVLLALQTAFGFAAPAAQ